MARRNRYGKDMDLQNEATKRYRNKQAAKRRWLNQLAEDLEVDPLTLISTSAAAVAALIKATGPLPGRNGE